MVSVGRRSPPLAFEVLHAYVAGEVDPAERAAIESQLATCEVSRARLDRVKATTVLFAEMAPDEPDDLAWQRIQNRVRVDLENAASGRLEHRPHAGPRVWLSAAIAIAATIATFVLLGRNASDVPVPAPDPAPAPGPQILASGSAPLEVKLASGTSLRLSPASEVVVKAPSALPTEVDLDVGELRVRPAVRAEGGRPSVVVRTPSYVATAKSLDFTVRYRGDGSFVESRDGSVEVKGGGFGERTIVAQGERRAPEGSPRVTAILEESVEKAKLEAARPVRETVEGETQVEVIDDEDPLKRRWVETARAYYERRDLGQAIELARQVIAEGGDRPEARLAEELLCDALIAEGRGEEAAEACAAQLARPHGDEERRQIHFRIATIHHRLGDCGTAIEHYGRAMVFGGSSLMDDRVRLFRAACALEVGDLELAGSDLLSLKNRRDRLPNPDELDKLVRRLQEAQKQGR
jgi:hypothetical protein